LIYNNTKPLIGISAHWNKAA